RRSGQSRLHQGRTAAIPAIAIMTPVPSVLSRRYTRKGAGSPADASSKPGVGSEDPEAHFPRNDLAFIHYPANGSELRDSAHRFVEPMSLMDVD
ncbi:MAG: hypothetical protein ABWY78_12840, partial [Microvirga sp.]